MSTQNMTVEHDIARERFRVAVGDEEAVLTYHLKQVQNQTRIDFTHTWVPIQARGKGIAEKLVRTGLSWAKTEGYEIHASCWYVAKFLAH